MRIKVIAFLYLLVTSLCIFQCGGGGDGEKAVDMISTRTMGLAYLEESKLPEAENAFQQLIKLAPDEPLGYANLGLVYIRMGNFEEAERQLKKALEKTPHDPEIRLNLSEVYMLTNRQEEVITVLEETLRHYPDHIRTLYKLGQLYMQSQDTGLHREALQKIGKVVDFLPANITARLDVIDLFLRVEEADSALAHLEVIKAQMPEFPQEADQFYDRIIELLRDSDAAAAKTPFNIFRNVIKPTPLFQVSFDELKGMGGPLIGTPLLTFRRDIAPTEARGPQFQRDVLEALRFTDATVEAGLDVLDVLGVQTSRDGEASTRLTVADFDGNGTQDLYVSGWDKRTGKNTQFLFSNDYGKFFDITENAGIAHPGEDKNSLFVDYDNDGYLDLYVSNTEGDVLYYHYEQEKFRRQQSAQTGGFGSSETACFADFDHDGDLDLFQARRGANVFYRNNLDGSFTDITAKTGVAGGDRRSSDLLFWDFDDDGDLEFFVANEDASNILYSNLRQGQFGNVSEGCGLASAGNSRVAAAGDYNNDGLVDLFVASVDDDPYRLYSNAGGAVFEVDRRSTDLESAMSALWCYDALFFDFDNDGYLDLLIVGEFRQQNERQPRNLLFHNDGSGIFEDFSSLLPAHLPAGVHVDVADYNEDGDMDIFLCGADGKVYLLRNDGGDANRYLKVQLVGLRTGSGKNNYFGIGAKLEVRAGDMYQSRVVTEPVSHFGLGGYSKADVVRVVWTNGVPQNLFEPGSDQALLEKQILKGSCPFLYAWDGQKYEFVTDVLWRSALGMPHGILGGERTYAFADPSQDYFKIPGEALRARRGSYSLQLTTELWETAYVDQVKLLAVDLPQDNDVFVDERFTPPPYPEFRLYGVAEKRYPIRAYNERGENLREKIRYKDDVYISDLTPGRYQGVTEAHDLVLELDRTEENEEIILYLNGWIFPTDASINLAMAQSSAVATLPPRLEVQDERGQWRTAIDNISFPMGKNKYVIVDLTDVFLSDRPSVRIRTTMQIYWDYIFYTVGEQRVPMHTITLSPTSAHLHYRGFSRMYRKGGRYGPHWFDYNEVNREPRWRDLEGYYTRYGDVRKLLAEPEGFYATINAGDEITLEFDAKSLPPVKDGWKRDFIFYTDGWLKDGDLNTAMGQTVGALPYRGMSRYPYEGDAPSKDEDFQRFVKEYLTRKVTTETFCGALSGK